MVEALVLLGIGVVALIVGLSQSSEQKKVISKTEEVVQYASNFIDNLQTMYRGKTLKICGVDFFMFDDVLTAFASQKLSVEYEEMLTKLEILKKEDDIRLFGDEEIETAIGQWTKIALARFMSKSQMGPEEAKSVLRKWVKGRSLITIVRSECNEKYGGEVLTSMQLFNKEEKHTLSSCEYTLDEMKKAMKEAEETFEKELISIKDKYLTFDA